jgi:ABC-2 type transport system ATP-binding protein
VPAIDVRGLTKSFGGRPAVEELSFSVEAGECFGLLGPNGAGKTSTIRMMIGITMPDSGEVRIFGQPFNREVLKRVGYLPEERGLYPKMKVIEQLIFIGELHGLSAAEAKKRALDWGERLDIATSYGKKTNELSKGMQQKIQFIATLLHDPDFIIMDEPFSGLDPVNSKLLEQVLIDLRAKGKSILFSTHRMEQVEKLCDSICLVNKGKTVLEGELREVKSRYGKNHVEIAFEESSDGAFLKDESMVRSLDRYEGHVLVRLVPGADPQKLLRMVSEKSRVNKFELMEPSLEEIFIEVVGKTDA